MVNRKLVVIWEFILHFSNLSNAALAILYLVEVVLYSQRHDQNLNFYWYIKLKTLFNLEIFRSKSLDQGT